MVSLVKSFKNKFLIIDNDYIFRLNHVNARTINWRCNEVGCNSTAISSSEIENNLGSFNVISIHNHVANRNTAIKAQKIYEMKVLVDQGFENPREIVHRILRGADAETILALGNFEVLYRTIRRYRASIKNPKPYLIQELQLGINLTITVTGQQFFQFGPENFRSREKTDEFIIFYSEVMVEKLKQHSVLAMDGTFEVVPKPYHQLFTISYIEEHHVFPVIFGILKDKRKETYSKFFNTIKHLINLNTIEVIKTDFELSSILALRENFADVQISGCHFHLGQSIARKILKTGLHSVYKTSSEVRKFTRSLLGLAYVQRQRVVETFNSLRSHLNFPIVLGPIYDYFFSTYIGNNDNAPFPLDYWNFGNDLNVSVPRTNNGIEGWHSVFKKTFGTTRYSFVLLVEKLKFEEDVIRIKSIRLENGEVLPRNEKYVDLENMTQTYFEENEGRNFGVDFVFGLSHFLYYD